MFISGKGSMHRQTNAVSDQQLRKQVHEIFRDKFEELERA